MFGVLHDFLVCSEISSHMLFDTAYLEKICQMLVSAFQSPPVGSRYSDKNANSTGSPGDGEYGRTRKGFDPSSSWTFKSLQSASFLCLLVNSSFAFHTASPLFHHSYHKARYLVRNLHISSTLLFSA
ncbi:hypothetical protein HBI56_162420 [Parastagonospora nodorum]|uniref:Uncharacterized protein n=1 Tax=Phaeosphaeria nodorum (strain SN15 / ATCC MYA-4574 / FGSC 10173) TaxID=321614 RepID=A0A7U2NPQ2_PHANO|nr:hypothetical protein HBH56_210220 [Parastagonospora nodorum]QRD05927.1 hypothetical protein JI435_445050 [Parastagonospora nodorum SN15]KAH3931654.1 hypothetical protein HBH54_098830 [Parastagonospora nodorum]KAH3944269.1 hypothetical protein HBH53_160290 [Parastagonospora nodorum]KAH3960772.1 hypothetical protein HBH51_188580 [Parastagonospora nodorum]